MLDRFDTEILELIPHRPPMLLINQIVSLQAKRSETLIGIDEQTPFLSAGEVPAWIGLEYMGQTSALIAGYQERLGLSEPQLGFLMGARSYVSEVDSFRQGEVLRIICTEGVLVGTSLANFECFIYRTNFTLDAGIRLSQLESIAKFSATNEQRLASATLSVFRKPLSELK